MASLSQSLHRHLPLVLLVWSPTLLTHQPTTTRLMASRLLRRCVCVCVCVKQKFVCNVLKVAKLTLNFLFRGKVVRDDLKILSVYVVGSDKFCGHVLKLQKFFPMTNFVWSAQTTKKISTFLLFFFLISLVLRLLLQLLLKV